MTGSNLDVAPWDHDHSVRLFLKNNGSMRSVVSIAAAGRKCRRFASITEQSENHTYPHATSATHSILLNARNRQTRSTKHAERAELIGGPSSNFLAPYAVQDLES